MASGKRQHLRDDDLLAKITAGIWAITVLVVYIFMFLGLTALINAQASVTGQIDPAILSDNIDFTNPFDKIQRCTGKGEAMNPFHSIFCKSLNLDPYDVEGCNVINGCTWENATVILGILFYPAGCVGYVNISYYGINGTYDTVAGYCSAPGIQTAELCETFKCQWFNSTEQFSRPVDVNSKFNTVSIWETIAWVSTFNIDLGWGSFNFLPSIFFYILLIILTMALYFIFVPF